MERSDRPHYSTWIRASKIRNFWLITFSVLVVSAGLTYFISPLFALLSIVALPFAYIAIVISLSAYAFSGRGGNLQNKIHQLIIDAAPKTGRTLDIGCGNGNLGIKLARQSSGEVVGVDYWGDDWEYSQSQCQRNAQLEGIQNIKFLKASASNLPFENNSFGAVVSCLTFHEVGDVARKVDSVAEALRVLMPGGVFVFFDLFDDTKYYKNQDEILTIINDQNCRAEKIQKLSDVARLGFPLNTGKVLKYAKLIVGKKEI